VTWHYNTVNERILDFARRSTAYYAAGTPLPRISCGFAWARDPRVGSNLDTIHARKAAPLGCVPSVRLRSIFCDNSGPRIVADPSQKIKKIARISPGLVDGR
jgi:hypothetical protein